MSLVRKISIGRDYKNDAMHYAVGQEVYGGHTICDIVENDDKFSIYIKKKNEVLPWKDFLLSYLSFFGFIIKSNKLCINILNCIPQQLPCFY